MVGKRKKRNDCFEIPSLAQNVLTPQRSRRIITIDETPRKKRQFCKYRLLVLLIKQSVNLPNINKFGDSFEFQFEYGNPPNFHCQ
jgi:hypothetical protein